MEFSNDMAGRNIEVLIVVDADGALSTRNLSANTYLIDTNKHMGSGGEGTVNLYTACYDEQVINWRVVGISPSSDVEIVGFTGSMVDRGVCKPKKVAASEDTYWRGPVQLGNNPLGNYRYDVQIRINNTTLAFDPYLKIQTRT